MPRVCESGESYPLNRMILTLLFASAFFQAQAAATPINDTLQFALFNSTLFENATSYVTGPYVDISSSIADAFQYGGGSRNVVRIALANMSGAGGAGNAPVGTVFYQDFTTGYWVPVAGSIPSPVPSNASYHYNGFESAAMGVASNTTPGYGAYVWVQEHALVNNAIVQRYLSWFYDPQSGADGKFADAKGSQQSTMVGYNDVYPGTGYWGINPGVPLADKPVGFVTARGVKFVSMTPTQVTLTYPGSFVNVTPTPTPTPTGEPSCASPVRVEVSGSCPQGYPCKTHDQFDHASPNVTFTIDMGNCSNAHIDAGTSPFEGQDTPWNTWLSAVRFSRSDPRNPDGTYSKTWNFCGLTAGGETCWTFSPGQKLYWRTVNSDTGVVVRTDGKAFSVPGPGPLLKPDLKVVSIERTLNAYRIKACNGGGTVTQPFWATLVGRPDESSAQAIRKEFAPPVWPGSCAEFEVKCSEIGKSCFERIRVRATVDSTGVINESNEGNNAMVRDFPGRNPSEYVREGIDNRISLARRLANLGADAKLVDDFAAFAQAEKAKYAAASTPAEKRAIILEFNSGWNDFKHEAVKDVIAVHARKAVGTADKALEMMDKVIEKLESRGYDVTRLSLMSDEVQRRIDAIPESKTIDQLSERIRYARQGLVGLKNAIQTTFNEKPSATTSVSGGCAEGETRRPECQETALYSQICRSGKWTVEVVKNSPDCSIPSTSSGARPAPVQVQPPSAGIFSVYSLKSGEYQRHGKVAVGVNRIFPAGNGQYAADAWAFTQEAADDSMEVGDALVALDGTRVVLKSAAPFGYGGEKLPYASFEVTSASGIITTQTLTPGEVKDVGGTSIALWRVYPGTGEMNYADVSLLSRQVGSHTAMKGDSFTYADKVTVRVVDVFAQNVLLSLSVR